MGGIMLRTLEALFVAIRFADIFQRTARLADDACRPRPQDYPRLLERAWAEAGTSDAPFDPSVHPLADAVSRARDHFGAARTRLLGPGLAMIAVAAAAWTIIAMEVPVKATTVDAPNRVYASGTESELPVQRWIDYTVVFEWNSGAI
jgi:hypothetical protein